MTWLDGQIDLIVANQTPGLITVWNRNPNTFALEGYGVTYDAMSPVQKQGVEQWLGAAPPKPDPTYSGGAVGGRYNVIMFDKRPGENERQGFIGSNLLGPVTIVTRSEALNSSQYYFGAGAWGTDYPPPFVPGYSVWPIGTTFRFQLQDVNTGGYVAPTESSGYPPLTAAELSTVQVFFSAVRSVAASGTGIRPEVIAQLTAQVEEVKQTVTPLRPAIEALEPLLAPLTPALTQLQLEIEGIKTKVQDILECTCQLIVEDCAGDDRVGLKEALKVIIGVVCEIQKKLGFSPGKITVPGTPPRDLLTVRESLADINRRLGFDNPLNVESCADVQEISNLEEFIALVDSTLGYSIGTDSGRKDALGQPIYICNVAASLSNVIADPGELVVFRGNEVDSLPVRILKINYNEGSQFRKQASMQIPNPNNDVTAAQILAVLGPKVSGDWYCQLTFTSGRKLLGWFENEDDGLAYLQLASGLSNETVVIGSGAATHNPNDAPIRYNGVTLNPTVAFVVPPKGEGRIARRIPLV